MFSRLSQPLLAACCSFLDLKAHLTVFARINQDCLQAAQLRLSWSGRDGYADDVFGYAHDNPTVILDRLINKYRFTAGKLGMCSWMPDVQHKVARIQSVVKASTATLREASTDSSELLQIVVAYGPHITSLKIPGTLIHHAKPLYPQLTRLEAKYWMPWNQSLLEQMPHLQTLCLQYNGSAKLPAGLTDLELCGGLTDSSLLPVKTLRQLRRLTLYCERLTSLQPVTSLSSLRELSLYSLDQPKLLVSLGDLTLEKLELLYLAHDWDWFLDLSYLVKSRGTLRRLHVDFEEQIYGSPEYDGRTHPFWVPGGTLAGLNVFPCLEELELSGLEPDNSVLTEFLRNSPFVPTLKSLSINWYFPQDMLPLLIERKAPIEVVALVDDIEPGVVTLLAQLPKLKKVKPAFGTIPSELQARLPHIESTQEDQATGFN